MLESRRGDTPSAGEILSLHADHRRGLHPIPVDDCTQCLFDALDGDGPAAAESAGAFDEPELAPSG